LVGNDALSTAEVTQKAWGESSCELFGMQFSISLARPQELSATTTNQRPIRDWLNPQQELQKIMDSACLFGDVKCLNRSDLISLR
jgi:hypothetical protein